MAQREKRRHLGWDVSSPALEPWAALSNSQGGKGYAESQLKRCYHNWLKLLSLAELTTSQTQGEARQAGTFDGLFTEVVSHVSVSKSPDIRAIGDTKTKRGSDDITQCTAETPKPVSSQPPRLL